MKGAALKIGKIAETTTFKNIGKESPFILDGSAVAKSSEIRNPFYVSKKFVR